jgi:hypothetical protein
MRVFIYFSFIIILFDTPSKAISINYKDKAISLIAFNVNISSETKRFLEQFESQFSLASNPNANKIIAKIKDHTWSSLVDSLQKNVGMIILPISTFGTSISYDNYGFPDVNVSKAQKKGSSKFYMKVELQIGSETLPPNPNLKKDTSYHIIKLKEGEIRPMVTITLTTFSNDGILPIGKYVGIAISPLAWKLDDSSIIDGMVNDNINANSSSLMTLINVAITKLSKNIH